MKKITKWHTYRWLLTQLRPYRKQAVLFLIAGLVVAFAEMWQLKTLQLMVDQAVVPKDMQRFWILLASFAVVFGLMMLAMTRRNVLERWIGERMARDIQLTVFSQLRRLGLAYEDKHPAGETLSMMNTDVDALQDMYRQYMPRLVNQILLLTITAVLVLMISPLLTLCTVPCYLLYYVFGPYVDRRVSRWGQARVERLTQWNQALYDQLGAMEEIRAYSQTAWAITRIRQGWRALSSALLRMMFFIGVRNAIRRMSSLLGLVVLYLVGAQMYAQGSLSMGEFVAFTLYYVYMMSASAAIISVLIEIHIDLFHVRRVQDFLGLKPEVAEPESPLPLPQPLNGRVSFDRVSFGYPSQPNILNDISLSIQPGERVAIVGASGGGKSTMLKLMARFYDPVAGRISLDGIDIRHLPLQALRQSFGYVFQETRLLASSIKDNIRFGRPDASDAEVEAVARRAAADAFIAQMPDGYDTMLGERGQGLSGGQRQRIAIARMLLADPPILLLDEATSALDMQREEQITSGFGKWLAGRTIIAVAHRLSTIREYDRIVVLDKGCIVQMGDYEQLMRVEGPFRQLALGELDAPARSSKEEQS